MPSPARDPLTSRPLSIWLVNPFDDVPGEGPPPLRYWSLARVLVKRGHDVTWWSATWSHRRKAVRSAPVGLHAEEGFNVRLVAVRPYTKNVSLARLNSHRDFGRTFERLATECISSGQLERPDIILASVPPLDSPEAALRLARKIDATFILDVMDLWPETFERLLPGPALARQLLAKIFLARMATRRAELVEQADALSAATEAYADTAFASAPSGTPRHVCYVGSYVSEFSEPVQSAYVGVATDGATAELSCVYAGSLEVGQDIQILPDVARRLSAQGVKATIHVAGSGKFEASLRRAAESQAGSCRVVVHGLLPRRDYVNLLSRCDVGLVCVKPETKVAMPYKAGDYAAAGLVMLNSLPGELSTMLDRYGAGSNYAPGDAASLADALAGLAADPKRLVAMRQAARRMAELEFDREKTYPVFADWIETVAGGV